MKLFLFLSFTPDGKPPPWRGDLIQRVWDRPCAGRMETTMTIVSDVLVLAVALLHLYFLYLEMFLWTKPTGLRVFRNTPEMARATRVLAANQGLYNGFLAAGLIWSLGVSSRLFEFDIKMFFLACVILAAIFGAYTVSRRILYIQGLPAILALAITVAFANPYLEQTDCCAKPQTVEVPAQ